MIIPLINQSISELVLLVSSTVSDVLDVSCRYSYLYVYLWCLIIFVRLDAVTVESVNR